MTWIFAAEITDEFVLGLDVLHEHNVSVDLGPCVLQLGEEEVVVWQPGACPCSFPYANGSNEVIEGWCGRVMTMQLKGSLEMVDSLLGLGSKAIHPPGVSRKRMLGQPPKEIAC
jgi:hypothetical protein